MVAAAVIGSAVVGVGGSLAAAGTAADATQSATNASIAEQQNALAQQATLSQPYRDLGSAAIPQYEALLGIGPQGSAGIGAALESTPGYQFTKQQGETGILNAASAQGGISGNTLAALDQYNSGLADSTYNSTVQNIAGAVGSGQAAAADQAQNVGSAAGTISNALVNQGNTTAGIDANLAAGLTKTIGNTADAYITGQTLSALNNQATPAAAGGGSWAATAGGQPGTTIT